MGPEGPEALAMTTALGVSRHIAHSFDARFRKEKLRPAQSGPVPREQTKVYSLHPSPSHHFARQRQEYGVSVRKSFASFIVVVASLTGPTLISTFRRLFTWALDTELATSGH